MINKKSYSNAREERRKAMDKLYINHQSESATENAGRNGYNLQEMSADINGRNPEDLYKEKTKPSDDVSKDVFSVLENLKTLSEENNLDKEAEFFSFLINKFSQVNKAENNYTSSIDPFNNLMIKISLTDIPDTNSLIKKLTKIYSKTILLEYNKNNDMNAAKKSAYNKVVHRAEQYLDHGKMIKAANVNTDNPILVAKNIKSIIDILVSQFSMEAKQRAYPNLKEKISNLNSQELSEKKSPGGAAIGTAINIVKNILKGRDPFFVNSVIQNLHSIL